VTDTGASGVVRTLVKADEMQTASRSHQQTPLEEDLHAVSLDTVHARLGCSPHGLTAAEAAARLSHYGKNTLREERTTSLIVKFAANFTHFMALLLWVGGAIGFVAQMPQLGIAIWAVNVINGLFSFWQEYKAEQAVAALRRLLPTTACVLRDGTEQRIPAEELVPGDILLLSDGDHISADGRVIAEAALRVDQSTLTGESYPSMRPALKFDTTPAVSGGVAARSPSCMRPGRPVTARGVPDRCCDGCAKSTRSGCRRRSEMVARSRRGG